MTFFRRMSGKKPMSSMRSASSRTKISMDIQADMALLHEVEQPPGVATRMSSTAVQGLDLGELADAAENDGVGETQMAAISGGALIDLGGQFAGR